MFSYLIILIKPWPGNYKTRLKRMDQKVDEDNGKALVKGNRQYRKFGRTFVVSFQLLPLVLGGRGCGRRKRIYK